MGLISVVTLIYNADALLYYALSPFLPCPEIAEIIIVNASPTGPSTDLSKKIIENFQKGKWGKKIKYFEGQYGDDSPENNWDIVQHNFAFEHCTCEWIWKVDSDEIYDSVDIATIIRHCKQATDYDYLRWQNLHFTKNTSYMRYTYPPIRCWRNITNADFKDLSVTPFIGECKITDVRHGSWVRFVNTYHYGFILPYNAQYQRINKFIQRGDNNEEKKNPHIPINNHLIQAWSLDGPDLLVIQSNPPAIKKALFYNQGANLTSLKIGIYTTGMYDKFEDVGGSELSLALCLQEFQRRGIEYVVNSNDPVDVHITFRENIDPININAKVKIFWSCDQYPKNTTAIVTNVNKYDLIFAISKFHQNYLGTIGIIPEKIKVINLGFNPVEYEDLPRKKKNQLIYCSQPDRGLRYLAPIFKKIVAAVPDASLVITCDKTLWGLGDPGNQEEKELFENIPNVHFLGKVPREELIALQKESEIMVFPCCYDELFCISAIECQAAGCAIVSSRMAALPETAPYKYVGQLFEGQPWEAEYQKGFAEYVIKLLTEHRYTLETFQRQARARAFQFYTWEDLVYEMSFYIDTIWKLLTE